ncbi:MAG: hypothetical protein QOI86_1036 [Actinomycetota bacterium]|nr:hypothetical protein [Actinomycetota bacterium]
MDQQDISVQPNETPVTAALRTLARVAGWCVTHTTDGVHAKASLHYSGRAVDLAARAGPGTDTSALLAINHQVLQLLPLSMISELIYAGTDAICVNNGRIVNGMSVYGPQVMAEHHNHVHLGVIPTFTYNGSQEVAVPDNDPNLPDIVGPVEIQVLCNNNGDCTGYFIFSHTTGELHSFGPGAKFYGRSEVTKLVAT